MSDFDSLVRESWPMVRAIAREYEIPGMESQDVEQEGLVALMEAARRFEPNRSVPFERYADMVVRLRLYDARTKATRKKHAPLNDSVTTMENRDGGTFEVLNLMVTLAPQPDDVAIARETLKALIVAVHTILTSAERIALQGILNDHTYDEIADELGVEHGRRYVDNAVQRARRKLRAVA